MDGVSEQVSLWGWRKPSCREGVLDILGVRFVTAGLGLGLEPVATDSRLERWRAADVWG